MNQTFTVYSLSSPTVSNPSPSPVCRKPIPSEHQPCNELAHQRLNDTFTFNLCNDSTNIQSLSKLPDVCASQKSQEMDQFQTSPMPNTYTINTSSKLDKKMSLTTDPNCAPTSSSSFFRACLPHDLTAELEIRESYQRSNRYANRTCEAVCSESNQLLSTYTFNSCSSRVGPFNQLLSTYTVDSCGSYPRQSSQPLSMYEIDEWEKTIFNIHTNYESSQLVTEKEVEPNGLESDRLPSTYTVSGPNIISHHLSINQSQCFSSSCKSYVNEAKHNQTYQHSSVSFEDGSKAKNHNYSQSCVNETRTESYQCCVNPEESAMYFCSGHDILNFPSAKSNVEETAGVPFIVDKSDDIVDRSPQVSANKETLKENDICNFNRTFVVDPIKETQCNCSDLQEPDLKNCSSCKYDAISAEVIKLFTQRMFTIDECLRNPPNLTNSCQFVFGSKSIPAKPENELDKSIGNPESLYTSYSEKSPGSKDIFSSAEFCAELENSVKMQNNFSCNLTQDSLFRILSQSKAYHHFKVKLENNRNVKISTQRNSEKAVASDPHFLNASSYETQFSPFENEAKAVFLSFENMSSRSALLNNEAVAKTNAPSISDALHPEPILPSVELESKDFNQLALISVDNLPVPSALPAALTSFHNKPVLPSALKSNLDLNFGSANSSYCTVIEVESESLQKQNKLRKDRIDQMTETLFSENRTEVNVLNTAYIAEESDKKEDSFVRCRQTLRQQNKTLVFEQNRKNKRSSQDSQRNSSVPNSSDEISKQLKSTSSSTKTHSSMTNSSSCIVESSLIHQEKNFRNKKHITVSSWQSKQTPCQKRGPFFKKHKTISHRKKKHQSGEDQELSSESSSSSSRVSISLKFPRRKRRKLFLKRKMKERRKNQTQMNNKKKCEANPEHNVPKLLRDPSCKASKAVNSSSSIITSIIESSLLIDQLHKGAAVSGKAVLNSGVKCSRRTETPVESSTARKSAIIRLCELNYFCVNVGSVNQEFLAYHGLLPNLHLQRIPPQEKQLRKRTISNSSVRLEDCKRRKIDYPPSENFTFVSKLFTSNSKKYISLSSSNKNSVNENESPSTCKNPAVSNLKPEKHNGDVFQSRNTIERTSSSSGLEPTNLTKEIALKSAPFERSLSVKARLISVCPKISENIASAICCHCKNIIPYGLAKKECVSVDTVWPDNKVPLCPSKICNKRKLYLGIFRTKLVLKPEQGDNLIARCASPEAEIFFGCEVRQFLKDKTKQLRIKERIAELGVAENKPKERALKNFNLRLQVNKNNVRVRIVNTNLFDP